MTDAAFKQFSPDELGALQKLRRFASDWCCEHQCAVGVTEMALGAALIAAGWQSGAMQMGVDFVAHRLSPGWANELTAAGSGVSGLGAYFLKNAGLTLLGGGYSIPALALAGGAALVFALAGYTAADVVQKFLHQAPDVSELVTATSLAGLGVWLLVDGAGRVPLVRQTVAQARDTGLYLARVGRDAVIDNAKAFAELVETEIAPFMQSIVNSGAGAALFGAAGLGTLGAVVAPSLVTVAGASTLGTAALSLGLVSAPVWPVVAGVGVGLAAGYGLWSLLRRDTSSLPDSVRQL